jgi:hypothetical protein
MSRISVTSNIQKVAQRFAGQINAKNIRFATAVSLTQMAQGAQASVRDKMPKAKGGPFHVRRNWVLNGVRIKSATKTNLEAAVFSLDSGGRRDFMGRQERGGVKRNVSGGEHIAVPLRAVRPTPQALIPQGYKPKNLLRYGPSRGARQEAMKQRAMAIKVKAKDIPGAEWILMAKGWKIGKTTGKRYRNYVPAWLLIPRAMIKRTEFLSGPARRFVLLNGYDILVKNFQATIRSG